MESLKVSLIFTHLLYIYIAFTVRWTFELNRKKDVSPKFQSSKLFKGFENATGRFQHLTLNRVTKLILFSLNFFLKKLEENRKTLCLSFTAKASGRNIGV